MATLAEMTKVRWCRVLRALVHPYVTREGNFFADSKIHPDARYKPTHMKFRHIFGTTMYYIYSKIPI
jgi:hypothetical protein